MKQICKFEHAFEFTQIQIHINSDLFKVIKYQSVVLYYLLF